MKRTVLFLLSFLMLFASLPLSSSANGKYFSWYCVHVKNHVQPSADRLLFAALDGNGFYADLSHGDFSSDDKVIYLTFDAGYENGNIEKILDVLKKEEVSAAFFVLQNMIVRETDLVKRMADEGHLVCNHTCRHKDMTALSKAEFCRELTDLETLYSEKIGGQLSKYYRPPEGKFTAENLKWASELGYQTVFWSFGYPDWDNNHQWSEEKAMKIVTDNLHNGEVMLLHPTSATNAAILGDLIRNLKAQGFRFGTLDEIGKAGDGV